jgi:hypothetical protein
MPIGIIPLPSLFPAIDALQKTGIFMVIFTVWKRRNSF